MQLIVMDLEWNSVFCRETGRYLNEIIEIGAVKLNAGLQQVDTFTQLISPVVGKKLQTRVKQLTNITNSQVREGMPFLAAMETFETWIGPQSCVVCTWGQTDLHTLLDNFQHFTGTRSIPFLSYYADLQHYAQEMMNLGFSQQLGLSNAAEQLGINQAELMLHRGLSDSLLTVECLRKVYDPQKFLADIQICNSEFFERLQFKPYVIRSVRSPLVDRSKLICYCPDCGRMLKKKGRWIFKNQSFRGEFTCRHCIKTFKVSIRYKKYYDYVDYKKKIEEIETVDE